ncbi:MAG TPA: prolyl oligopeptidase family serine peptidase [Bacteroidota bacterium]|nr:prolyl oligopeptidase family serine peptidase [Bacteroidota bacterium]
MRKKIALVFLLSITTLSLSRSEPLKQSGSLHSGYLRVKSLARQFYYYVPRDLADSSDLIFVLHGSGMTAKGMEVLTGRQFDKLADKRKNLIIVYPQGYGRYWNDCRTQATFDAKKMKVDDVAFFESMIKFFNEKFSVDEKSVFVVGYSNGGEMCFKLAKERPDLFKGFAAVSANLPVATNNDCTETGQPVSMLVINGTADPIDPYNGGLMKAGDGKQRGKVISTPQTMDYWLKLDKADSTSMTEHVFPDIDESDKSTAVEDLYDCPQTQKKVALIKVVNGGHIFMNDGFSYWPRVYGRVNKDINAPAVILDFFKTLQ